MKTHILLVCLVLLPFAFSTIPANADGFAMYTDQTYFALHDETTQVAAINYENGTEKLLLAVKMDKIVDNSIVWIVPVPAEASEVKINILEDFPEFWGEDILLIAEESKDTVFFMSLITGLTQIWTLPLLAPFWMLRIGGMVPPKVEVYAHVEKEGITTEVITAETATALYEYLEGKNVTIPSGSIPILDEYIGEGYAFVASWVQAIPTGREDATPAIFVEFPTDSIYYPLKPTSLYGDSEIPVLLYVVGYAVPNLYPEIEDYAEYRYFEGSINCPPEFYRKDGNSPVAYTRIMIGSTEDWYPIIPTPPAKSLVDDLWIKQLDEAPPQIKEAKVAIQRADYFDDHWAIAFIIWVVVLSLAAGALAGFVVFRKPGKFALVGLANCLTLIGIIVATIFLAKNETGRMKKWNRLLFIVLFSVFFVAMNFLVVYPAVKYLLFV